MAVMMALSNRFSWLRGNDLISQFENGLQRANGGKAVVFLFAVGQVGVGDQAGMEFLRIIALGTEAPALGETLRGPHVVSIFSETLG